MTLDETWSIGPGLSVRRLCLDDSEALFALVARNRERLQPWLPWVEDVRVAADVGRFIADSQRVTEVGPVAHECGIEVEGALKGAIGLNRFDWAQATANLGYWVDSSIEGKGLVTRAAPPLIRFGFDVLGLERIELRAAADNLRSRRVAERVGFRLEGVLRSAEVVGGVRRDVAVYGLLPTDLE